MTENARLPQLLSRQVEKATTPDKGLDIHRLLDLVSAAYEDHERDRRRTDRANALMAEELEDALSAIELQNIRFKAALDNMPQGLRLFDRRGKMAVCNPRFQAMYDIPDADCRPGNSLAQLLGASRALTTASEIERRMLISEHVQMGEGTTSTLEQNWPDGRKIVIQRTGIADGGYLDTIADVTESRKATAQIAHLARHDALTSLPNRVLLRERMQEIVRNAQRGDQCAIMCLDLDRFKLVNDTLGHPIGDALLVMVAERLKAELRSNDVVARLGGDEFAIIQQHVRNIAEPGKLASRIIKSISKPYVIEGHKIQIGTSIGIEVVFVNNLDSDLALRNADMALYDAKTHGRGTYRLYSSEMHDVATQRRLLENDLRDAFAKNQFIVHYQPQYDTNQNDIIGFEALVRWEHPVRGRIPPNQFIPVCEEMGLIDELGKIVLKTACTDAGGWPDHIGIAVNLSPVQFRSRNLPTLIREAVEAAGLSPNRLELEITESVMLEDFTAVLDQLRSIKRLGCQVSLDDFGTGYSSLSYIRHFPFDRIKIDQSFVRDLADTSDSLAIIRAVVGLCGSLNIKSTAEGVETLQQLEILCREQCDSVQGYLFSEPIPLKQTYELLDIPVRRKGRKAAA
jgi:diguanylate cyclase (GGDEF)-like protein